MWPRTLARCDFECGLASIFVGGANAVSVGSERNLRVDDEIAAAGQKDDDVGADRTRALSAFPFDREGLLECVLLAFAQACLVEQVAKNEFAPVALRFGRAAKRGGEVAGFFGQCLVESAEGADEGFEFGDACFGVALCLFDFFAELLDLIAEWIEQGADFFLAAFGERFGFLVEDVGGERGKLVGERLLGGYRGARPFRSDSGARF